MNPERYKKSVNQEPGLMAPADLTSRVSELMDLIGKTGNTAWRTQKVTDQDVCKVLSGRMNRSYKKFYFFKKVSISALHKEKKMKPKS